MSSDQRNVSLIVTVLGVVSALLVLLSLGIFIQGWAQGRLAAEERSKIFDRPYPELEAYREEQEQKLSEYHWIDKEAGTVHLPIERAMTLVVEERGEVAP